VCVHSPSEASQRVRIDANDGRVALDRREHGGAWPAAKRRSHRADSGTAGVVSAITEFRSPPEHGTTTQRWCIGKDVLKCQADEDWTFTTIRIFRWATIVTRSIYNEQYLAEESG
jgi:hypothetical protein